MIKYLFFDFDGTISDARDLAIKSLTRVLDEYDYEFSESWLGKMIGTKMTIMLKDLGVNPGHLSAMRRRFYKYFKKGALEGEIKLCVSVKPLWELSKDYPLIVISNSETSFVEASIRKLEIKGLFKKVYGAEKFSSKDVFLTELFKKYKIKPNEAVYVGDRFSDIEYARNAGCVAIAIHNKCSWSDLRTVKKEKPDYIIKDFRELKKVIRELNRG